MSVAPKQGIVEFGPFIGATPASSGTQGEVPAPVPAESALFLRGDGAWAAGGGGGGGVAISAGTNSTSTGTVVFSNSNGVSFGMNTDGVITATVVPGAAAGIAALAAGTQTATSGTVVFSNSNGISFGLSGSTRVTASYTVPTVTNSSWTASDQNTSMTIGQLAFTGSNGLTLSLSTTTGGSATLIGSYTVPNVPAQTNQTEGFYAVGNTTQNSSTTLDARTVSFGGRGIVTVGYSNGTVQISATEVPQTNQSAIKGFGVSNTGQTAGNTGISTGIDWVMAGSGSITLSQSTAGGGPNTVWIQHPAWITTARASTDAIGLNTAKTNVTWTVNSSGLSLDAGGYAGTGFTTTTTTGTALVGTHNTAGLSMGVPAWLTAAAGGNNLTLQDSATTLQVTKVVFSNSNGVSFGLSTAASIATVTASVAAQSNQTVGLYATGNTTNNSSTTFDARTLGSWNAQGAATVGFSNGSVQLSVPATSSLVGINGISISSAGSTISVMPQWISSYENFENCGSNTMTLNAASVSHAVAFYLGQPISGSFLRLPVLMTTNSTTIATMASATASASGNLFSTWNVVVYSMGVGANSQSLQSVASGSGGFTFQNRISITNSTQYSITQGFSAQALGAGTTRTTQYSISNTNYSFTTNQIATEWSSGRFLDIPFASSLTPGAYWLVFGYSSSTNSAGAAGLAALTNCNVRYSNHYAVSQVDIPFGIMGSTNLTSGGLLGAGSFSTAGGGTTNSIPVSAISSSASQVRPYFQILRSA